MIIIGTNSRTNRLVGRISKLLHKKVIYIMHGYNGFEWRINNPNNCIKAGNRETKILNLVDIILPVSERYKEFFLGYRPEYRDKTHFLMNGIDAAEYEKVRNDVKTKKRADTVVVCGANRSIKKNSVVCEAIRILNDKKPNRYHLDIFGQNFDGNELLPKYNNIEEHGLVTHDELMKNMSHKALFVLNTMGESYGLSAIDALMCGCSVLISANAGVTSILELSNDDLIFDYSNKEEIAQKIEYIIKHPNSKRIKESINFDKYSWKMVANRLEKIAEKLADGKTIDDIRTVR